MPFELLLSALHVGACSEEERTNPNARGVMNQCCRAAVLDAMRPFFAVAAGAASVTSHDPGAAQAVWLGDAAAAVAAFAETFGAQQQVPAAARTPCSGVDRDAADAAAAAATAARRSLLLAGALLADARSVGPWSRTGTPRLSGDAGGGAGLTHFCLPPSTTGFGEESDILVTSRSFGCSSRSPAAQQQPQQQQQEPRNASVAGGVAVACALQPLPPHASTNSSPHELGRQRQQPGPASPYAEGGLSAGAAAAGDNRSAALQQERGAGGGEEEEEQLTGAASSDSDDADSLLGGPSVEPATPRNMDQAWFCHGKVDAAVSIMRTSTLCVSFRRLDTFLPAGCSARCPFAENTFILVPCLLHRRFVTQFRIQSWLFAGSGR